MILRRQSMSRWLGVIAEGIVASLMQQQDQLFQVASQCRVSRPVHWAQVLNNSIQMLLAFVFRRAITWCYDGSAYVLGPGSCTSCATGYAESGGFCLACSTHCQTCSTPTICLSCYNNNLLQAGLCQLCDRSCAACSAPLDPNSCTQCTFKYRLSSGACLQDISCYLFSNTACVACLGGFWYGVGACHACYYRCLTCSGSAANDCNSCFNSASLILGQCYPCDTGIFNCNACPLSYYNVNQCQRCVNGCLQCTNAITCMSCVTHLVLYNSACHKCHPTCALCSGGNVNQCTSCPGNMYLGSDNRCHFCALNCAICNSAVCLSCDIGHLSGGVCCSAECLSCSGPTALDCTACRVGYIFIAPACVKCYLYCNSCTSAAQNACTTCSPTYFQKLGYCQTSCGTSYYSDVSKVCHTCDPSCLNCNGPAATQCTSCADFFFAAPDSSCQACSFNCRTCSSASSCLTCDIGVLSVGKCCTLGCLGCTGPTSFDCVDCQTNYIMTSQPGGSICEICFAKCATCSGVAADDCLTCVSGLYLKNGQCQTSCGIWYYGNSFKVCKNCMPLCRCTTCTGSTSCIAYVTGLWLDAIEQRCWSDCPAGQYKAAPSVCALCIDYCQSCDANECFYCLNGHWLDIVDEKCEIQCPVGQFKSHTRGRCQLCPPSCAVCTTLSQCHSCANNYLRDRRGECYKCNCGDCGVCPKNCPQKTLFYKNNCYGVCPAGSYRKSVSQCQACESPCAMCSQAKHNCTMCQHPLILQQNKCVKECEKLYYNKNQECESCIHDGVFLSQIQACNAAIPVLTHSIECTSPSTPQQTIILKSTIPISKIQQIVNIKLQSQQSNCFQTVFKLPKATESQVYKLTVEIGNHDCKFVHRKIKVTVTGIAAAIEGLYFNMYSFYFDWPLGGGQVGGGMLFSLQKAKQILKYGSLVPIVGTVLPMLQMTSVLANVKNMPYQAYMLASTLATQQIHFGCYDQQSYSNTLAALPFTGSRLLQETTKTPKHSLFASSELFFLDFMVSIAWIVLGYLFLLITWCAGSYQVLAQNILFKLHQACLLMLCCSIVANNHDTLAGKFGLFAGIASVLYYLGYWAYYASRLYCLQPDCEGRYTIVERLPVLLNKINWVPQKNEAVGPMHILDPVYYRLLTQLISLIFYLVMVLVSDSTGQLAALCCMCGVNLVRLLWLPLFPCYLNWLQAVPFCFLLAYASLGLFSLRLSSKLQQAYDKQLASEWSRVGWGMAAMVVCTVLSVIIKEITFWSAQESLEEVSLDDHDLMSELEKDNTRREISLQMDKCTMRSAFYQIQKILVVRERDVFTLRSTAILEIKSSMLKRFINNQPGQFKSIVQRLIRVNHNNPIYYDLDRLAKDHDQFVVRTVGLYQDQRDGDSVLVPKNLYNVVTYGEQRVFLKGNQHLTWTPLVHHI